MMKWKVTRGPRCASADRSLDLTRKIVDEAPDPEKLRSTFTNDSKNGHQTSLDKDVGPLSENRKPAQNTSDAIRKSFIARDGINLKGIFGLTKDKNEGHQTSRVIENGERKRSRSEVRGTSIDRLTVGYHANPLFAPQNGYSKSKTTSSSPVENDVRWTSRGRRRERDSRMILQSNSLKDDTVTVITDSNPKSTSIKKKHHQSRLQTPEIVGKTLKPRPDKPKTNGYKEKENQHATSPEVAPPVETELNGGEEKIGKPLRNKKKRIAPKPHARLSLVEDYQSEPQQTFPPSTSVEDDATARSGKESLSSYRTDSKTFVGKNVPPQPHLSDAPDSKIIVKAEVHADRQEKLKIKRSVDDDAEAQKFEQFDRKSFRKGPKLSARKNKHVQFCDTAKNIEIPPEIDDPDYTPVGSSDEAEIPDSHKRVEDNTIHMGEEDARRNSIETIGIDELYKNTTVNDEELKNGITNILVESPPPPSKTAHNQSVFNCRRDTTAEEPIGEAAFNMEQSIDPDVYNDTITNKEIQIKTRDNDFVPKSETHCMEETVHDSSVDSITDGITDSKEEIAGDAIELNYPVMIRSDDVSIKDSSDVQSPKLSRSPTPPPRKKVASAHKELTVNVVVRQSPINGTLENETPQLVDKELPASFVMRKSFVITVAKQNEGFRSLCASRGDLSFAQDTSDSIKDNRISVTFLCSETQSEEDCLDGLRFRSVSVPPHCTHEEDLHSLISHRSCSKDRRCKQKHSTKKKGKSRKRVSETVFHMPQAVIDELSQVLEHRKVVPEGQVY